MVKTNWHSVREYEVLRAMILSGTTTAAAVRLGLSQSAVSRSLAALEHRSGRLLFTRNGNRLEPTAEAVELDASLDALFSALEGIEGRRDPADTAQLRIAAPPTIAHRFLQRHASSFLTRNPAATILFEVCASDALLAGVAEERFDIGITDLETSHSGIRITPFRRSSIVCICPADHPLAALETVRAQDLAGQPLVALTKRHSLRTWTDRALRNAGLEPDVRIETATAVTAVDFVRMGAGCALLNPFPVASGLGSDLAIRPFDPALIFQTAFLTSANRAPDAQIRAFMRHVRLESGPDPWSVSA